MLAQPQYGVGDAYAYVSPVDGVAHRIPGGSVDAIDSIILSELAKVGELVRELRAEVEALKAKVG